MVLIILYSNAKNIRKYSWILQIYISHYSSSRAVKLHLCASLRVFSISNLIKNCKVERNLNYNHANKMKYCFDEHFIPRWFQWNKMKINYNRVGLYIRKTAVCTWNILKQIKIRFTVNLDIVKMKNNSNWWNINIITMLFNKTRGLFPNDVLYER